MSAVGYPKRLLARRGERLQTWTLVHPPTIRKGQNYDAEYACGKLRGTPSLPDKQKIERGDKVGEATMIVFK